MFFVVSKLLYFLVNPVNWVFAGIICWIFIKRPAWNKRIGWVTFIIFFLFSNNYLYRAAVLTWQGTVTYPNIQQPYAVGVLLGGMTFSNVDKQQFFGGTSDRFIQAAQLYHTGKVKRILISGGDGSLAQDRPKEADFLRLQLLKLAIPDSAIIIEPLSKNTYENAVACRKLLDSLSIVPKILLVSSAEHLPRARACFKKQGIDTEVWPANFVVVENRFSLAAILLPDIDVINRWQFLLKEMIGLQVYKWSGKA